MKAIIGVFFLITLAFAADNTHAIKAEILEKIFANISMKKELIIWSDDKELIGEFDKKGTFTTTTHCKDATLLILENKKNIEKVCHEKAVFVLDYALLKEIPQSFGAIFWKKGRPNIVILAPRAKAQSIIVSDKLDDYVEDKIW
ncbi:MAG: hypothetical protein PHO62_08225 [Sulfurimonas sp.]|uniref:hypothetical protein n=1 Tax=Sulfurimonas sp. TaxID=2022749 RepID=UPI00262BC4D2|nr:hypothetical protein [Sulfurimonas sp.]MDD5373395.1 hypothetical protein [Sulfurimonas sp.]